MAPSKDKLIDRISYWKSGAFYGFGEGIKFNDIFSYLQKLITRIIPISTLEIK